MAWFDSPGTPPWFGIDDEGGPPNHIKYSPFRTLAYASCPLCRTGGTDPDVASTFVDARLPTDGTDPGLRDFFEGVNFDIQIDFTYVHNPSFQEEWDFIWCSDADTKKSLYHAIKQENISGSSSATITLPTINTVDDFNGPVPPFQIMGFSSSFDDPDTRLGKGTVWRVRDDSTSQTLSTGDDASRHRQTDYTLVSDCTTPGASTTPTEPADEDDDFAISAFMSLKRLYGRVCRTVDGDYKLSLIGNGTVAAQDSAGQSGSAGAEFFIYTGDWDDAKQFFDTTTDLDSLPTDYTLGPEQELDQELFGATVFWRVTGYSHEFNQHDTAIAGNCSMACGSATTHKTTSWEGEVSIALSNLIVTASLP